MNNIVSVLRFKQYCDEHEIKHLRMDASERLGGEHKSYLIYGVYAQPNVICLKAGNEIAVLYNVKDIILEENDNKCAICGVIRQIDYLNNAQIINREFVVIRQS